MHIVITDGADTSSNTKVEDLGAIFLILGKTIPKECLRTIFIGIDLENDK